MIYTTHGAMTMQDYEETRRDYDLHLWDQNPDCPGHDDREHEFCIVDEECPDA